MMYDAALVYLRIESWFVVIIAEIYSANQMAICIARLFLVFFVHDQ